VNPFIDLPPIRGTVEAENGSVEQCCDRPGAEPSQANGAIEQIGKVGRQINRGLPDGKVVNRRPFKEPKPAVASQSRIEKMILAAHEAAGKYRNYAPHVCCRRAGRRAGCGINYCGGTNNFHKSKGWCKSGVREAIYKATGKMISGESATNAKAWLNRNFTAVAQARSCKEAPVGAICLYDRRPVHNFGHIEIRTGTAEYCSDFCTNHPIRVGKFIGAYIP
jgi:hypothetical protein